MCMQSSARFSPWPFSRTSLDPTTRMVAKKKGLSAEQQAELQEAFNLFDADKSGQIDVRACGRWTHRDHTQPLPALSHARYPLTCVPCICFSLAVQRAARCVQSAWFRHTKGGDPQDARRRRRRRLGHD